MPRTREPLTDTVRICVIDGEIDETRRIPLVPLLPPVPAAPPRLRVTRRGRLLLAAVGALAAGWLTWQFLALVAEILRLAGTVAP